MCIRDRANILRNATRNSLVLVDEIGRGTSTYDGLSLAWACAIDLAKRVQAFSLFATHYFEITELADSLESLKNVHLDAVEHGQDIVFMYKLKQGPANQSYGIQVARLAGLPEDVLAAARTKLKQLETPIDDSSPQTSLVFSEPVPSSLHKPSEVEQALSSLEPDELSARQALDILYDLKSMTNR